MRILLVDDDPEMRFAASFALGQNGHEVVEAADGASALRAATHDRFDVVLLDVILGPHEDGGALAGELRAHPALAGASIVFLTGHTNADEHARLLDAGGVGVITKPFALDTLCAQLDAVLARA